MLILLTTVAIGGILLGLRFKVLILVPAIVLGAIAALGIARHHNGSHIAISVTATVILIQLAYMAGSALETYFPLRVETFLRHVNWQRGGTKALHAGRVLRFPT
jgi:hypothetical protein